MTLVDVKGWKLEIINKVLNKTSLPTGNLKLSPSTFEGKKGKKKYYLNSRLSKNNEIAYN